MAELSGIKPITAAVCLTVFWLWESAAPFFGRPRGRLRHAGWNLLLAGLNTVALAFLFSAATVAVATATQERGWGLLNGLGLPGWLHLVLAMLLLDAWLYLWHRANHRLALLWRFHRMHHSDSEMDVTTATRFHLGEHIGATVLRLGLIPLLGLTVVELVLYESMVVAVTMFHHANISLGRWDDWLRIVVVTPNMHKVHHSRYQIETDSNYSTCFSWWDRLGRSFQMRQDCRTIELGLDGYDEGKWQNLWGMLKTPFVGRPSAASSTVNEDPGRAGE